jgi:hypothetical protein
MNDYIWPCVSSLMYPRDTPGFSRTDICLPYCEILTQWRLMVCACADRTVTTAANNCVLPLQSCQFADVTSKGFDAKS